MTTRPDYYAVLGVSPVSDDVVIRAAFKALMLKYHPDTNKSADATQRAAAINEAFSVLGDQERRVAYDASRRSGERSPPPPPPPPPSPPKRPSPPPNKADGTSADATKPSWLSRAGGVLVIALIGGGIRFAVQEANRPTPTSAPYQESWMSREGMETMNDNMMAVDQATAQTSAASGMTFGDAMNASDAQAQPETFGYQAPTNIDFSVIEGAANTFAKVLNRSGIMGARAWSTECHDKASKNPSWPAADRCAAFDYAARYMDLGMVKAAGIRANPYFAFQADNQADSYKIVGASPFSVGERLKRIETAVEPIAYDAIAASISERQAQAAEPKPAETTDPENPSMGATTN